MTDTQDFFRSRLDAMIDLRHPLAILATRLPWTQIEAALAPLLQKASRERQAPDGIDLLGPTSGAVLRTTTHSYLADSNCYVSLIGYTYQKRTDGDLAYRVTPEQSKVVTQQGTSFSWTASDFDDSASGTVSVCSVQPAWRSGPSRSRP